MIPVRLKVAAALAVLLGEVGQTKAEFIHPPETNWSPPWVGAAPYQRDITWSTFSENPVGGPSPDGTPGAQYSGTLDGQLKSSDKVAISGSVQWIPSITLGPGKDNTYFGVVGIDNRTGTTKLKGTYTVYLDNTTTLDAQKNVWVETLGTGSGGGLVSLSLVSPRDSRPPDAWARCRRCTPRTPIFSSLMSGSQ